MEQDRAESADLPVLCGGVRKNIAVRNMKQMQLHSLSVHTYFTRRGVSLHYSLLVNTFFFFFSECYSVEQAVLELRMEQGRMLFLEERSYSTGEEQVLGSRTIQKWP